uniref:Enoyl reductase (ER) domain-containing protein n=1 Tax=Corethron hystrix TaxID=216773 RepID=A0A6U5EL67_9STRA|mmetsp:Transcript_18584/g.42484  ORF Transcript_18584/g.42484 Transcript_18584/m.42484 type:complete len:442 (+) Transcript_18584:222-1547(+)
MEMSLLKSYSDQITLKKLVSTNNCRVGDSAGYGNAMVLYEKFGDAADVMYMCEYKAPHKLKSAEDIVIQVQASNVTMTDCLIRGNSWYKQAPLPNTVGSDCVGRVYGVGRAAFKSGVRPGDKVAAISRYLGGSAKFTTVEREDIIPVPDGIHPSIAVSIIRNYVTAYQNLYRCPAYPMERTDRVLIIGADEAPGEAAVELAILGGAQVYATARSAKHPYLQSLGAKTFSHKDEWLSRVEGRMDLVIDYVGEDGFESSHAALDEEGQLVCVGIKQNGGTGADLFGISAMSKWTRFRANFVLPRSYFYDIFESIEDDRDTFVRDAQRLFKLYTFGKISPKISHTIALSEIATFHQQLEMGEVKGTVVCDPQIECSKDTPRSSINEHSQRRSKINEANYNACLGLSYDDETKSLYSMKIRNKNDEVVNKYWDDATIETNESDYF